MTSSCPHQPCLDSICTSLFYSLLKNNPWEVACNFFCKNLAYMYLYVYSLTVESKCSVIEREAVFFAVVGKPVTASNHKQII